MEDDHGAVPAAREQDRGGAREGLDGTGDDMGGGGGRGRCRRSCTSTRCRG